MITFHNDHLVAPEFCELIYQTIPEHLHRPVIFNTDVNKCECAGERRYSVLGHTDCRSVTLHLQSIYYHGCPGSYPEFSIWKQLLHTTYHEFGHIADTAPHTEHGYDNDHLEYLEIEKIANDWADVQILKLADVDKRIAQPKNIGKYFNARLIKRNAKISSKYGRLPEYRMRMSGGQYTITGMSYRAGADGNRRLIRRLAEDLAYKYTDNAGRVLFFFAHGDIPEIERRVARHYAIHPRPLGNFHNPIVDTDPFGDAVKESRSCETPFPENWENDWQPTFEDAKQGGDE
jgi:hypothetical protein